MSFDFEEDLDYGLGISEPVSGVPIPANQEDDGGMPMEERIDLQPDYIKEEEAHAEEEPDTEVRHGTKRPLEAAISQDSVQDISNNGGQTLDEEEEAFLLQEAKQSGNTVCIANLHWWTTDAEIDAACMEFGQVVSIKFVEDRYNGKSKGCAMVEFSEPSSAVSCKEQLQGCLINGKPTVVTFAGKGMAAAMAQQHKQQQNPRGRQDGGMAGWNAPGMQSGGGYMMGRGRGPRGGPGRFGPGGFPMGMGPGMGGPMGMGPMGMGPIGMTGMGMPGMGPMGMMPDFMGMM